MTVEYEFSSTGTAHIVTSYDAESESVETKCNETLDSTLGPVTAESTGEWPSFVNRCRNCSWDEILLKSDK